MNQQDESQRVNKTFTKAKPRTREGLNVFILRRRKHEYDKRQMPNMRK